MPGRAKVHEKQANRKRSEKLGAAQNVHAWSRSTAYTYPQCSVLRARSSKSSKLHWAEKNVLLPGCTCARRACYARFTLADPMPRLGSDVVGGNSGRNHPTSRRHTIHIGRMARNVSVGTRESYNIVRLPGWYGERVLLTLSCVVHVRLPIGRRRRAILNMFNIAR